MAASGKLYQKMADGTLKAICYGGGGSGGGTDTNSYCINVFAYEYNPDDGVTRYFGARPQAPVTTDGVCRIYVPTAGIITAADIYTYSTTAGSAEDWSFYVRLNSTTDYLIQAVGNTDNARRFTNAAMSVPLVVGDYIEIKMVQPTWTTNPVATKIGGYIYIVAA